MRDSPPMHKMLVTVTVTPAELQNAIAEVERWREGYHGALAYLRELRDAACVPTAHAPVEPDARLMPRREPALAVAVSDVVGLRSE